MWCVTHQPFHARQQPVPSSLPSRHYSPSGAHGASHPQCRPEDLPAFQLWQVQQEGRVLFYPQVLGPRLWWRALRQGLAMCCTNGPVISSELTPFYKLRAHTTLRPVNSHHSTSCSCSVAPVQALVLSCECRNSLTCVYWSCFSVDTYV